MVMTHTTGAQSIQVQKPLLQEQHPSSLFFASPQGPTSFDYSSTSGPSLKAVSIEPVYRDNTVDVSLEEDCTGLYSTVGIGLIDRQQFQLISQCICRARGHIRFPPQVW